VYQALVGGACLLSTLLALFLSNVGQGLAQMFGVDVIQLTLNPRFFSSMTTL
jgi:hypothetical protein